MAQETEREKMLRGAWYDANFDKALIEERRKAELACHAFNQAEPGSEAQLNSLRKLLGGKVPDGVTVLAPVYFDYGGNFTTLGEGTFVNRGQRHHQGCAG